MKIVIKEDEVKKDQLWEAIERWIRKHDATMGEVIMQSDKCLLSAPELLTEIVDEIIKPEVIWEEECQQDQQ